MVMHYWRLAFGSELPNERKTCIIDIFVFGVYLDGVCGKKNAGRSEEAICTRRNIIGRPKRSALCLRTYTLRIIYEAFVFIIHMTAICIIFQEPESHPVTLLWSFLGTLCCVMPLHNIFFKSKAHLTSL